MLEREGDSRCIYTMETVCPGKVAQNYALFFFSYLREPSLEMQLHVYSVECPSMAALKTSVSSVFGRVH